VIEKVDGCKIGTGAYLVMMKLIKRVSSMIPMFGQKVNISYKGNPTMCKSCNNYHKIGPKCEQRSWPEYANQFQEENPYKSKIMYKSWTRIWTKAMKPGK
jgi:hypothetical protein